MSGERPALTIRRLERVQRLFEEALPLPADQRAALLDRTCAADAELRAEVESLLAHAPAVAPDFLVPPAAPPDLAALLAGYAPTESAPKVADPLIGVRIGHYQIVRVIARGGMATVYEALQDDPRRTVALKVMRTDAAAHSALRRFQYEAQVLGHLRHPNIAQVYEAGVHQFDPSRDREGAVAGFASLALPYFAMEYIPDAQPITRYADQHALDTRTRLELFTVVCDAVQHGHQKGVIHRDLKPANILVDAAGAPKVIDFGVARVTDKDIALTTQHTSTGQLIGTVQYMSPEQCEGDPGAIDTRSDVYSLGVVLYELLTGALPYEATGVGLLQATRIIREQPARRPSTINRRLRGDAETIILKALDKDRDKRYASAAELAQDIRRCLNHEPIEARAPTALTRAVRRSLRHPAARTTALCLATGVLVTFATVAAVWMVNSQPYELLPSKDRSSVELQARDHRPLRTWRTGAPGGVGLAEMVDCSDARRKLVFLGFAAGPNPQYQPGLHLYNPTSPERPITVKSVRPSELPSQPRAGALSADDFGVSAGLLADVFPDAPSPQVIAVLGHAARTHSAIRVYDRELNLLYQVWVDAQIRSVCWMPQAGLIVCAAWNGEVPWELRGRTAGHQSHPSVVFAVRPVRAVFNEYLVQEIADRAAARPELRPLWYRCVGADADGLRWSLIPRVERLRPPSAQGGASADERVLFQVGIAGTQPPEASFWWVLGPDGSIVGDQVPLVSQVYDRNHLQCKPGDPQRLPDARTWTLADLPPITSQPAPQ